MLNTNIYLPKELTSGWELGESPTPETIRQGTVRMEEHPDYETAIQKAKDAGFEIIFTNEASVKWTELYDLNQKFVRLERLLNVVARMRYLDLEHELGHIDQFSRFGDKVPPLEKKIQLPNGFRRDVDVLAGIMSNKQVAILEYHNRLVEFVRLYERRVDLKILKEHAYGSSLYKNGGLVAAYEGYLWGTNREMSKTRRAWIEKYFPEIPDLKKRYEEMLEIIEAGQYTVDC